MKERMIAALAAALVALSPAGASAQSSPAEQIAAVQTEAMRGFLAASPETATFLGDYRYDGEWSDPTPAGIAKFKAMLASYQQRVDAIDVTGATLQDRNDIKLMKAFVTSQNRQLADQEAGAATLRDRLLARLFGEGQQTARKLGGLEAVLGG